jgi:hypothetical protein
MNIRRILRILILLVLAVDVVAGIVALADPTFKAHIEPYIIWILVVPGAVGVAVAIMSASRPKA